VDGFDAKTRETLEKQLQLLSERSTKATDADLANLTYAMTDIARILRTKAASSMSGPAFEAKAHSGSQPERSAGQST